ncbi:MAG: hypothetical protein Q9162_006910 [Coniocarpon cinnabarinum]
MSAPNPNEGRSQWKRGRFGWELVPVPHIAPEDNPFSPHYSEKPQHYQYPPAQHPGLMGSLTSELEHLHLYPHSNSSLLHPQPLPPHAATFSIQDIPVHRLQVIPITLKQLTANSLVATMESPVINSRLQNPEQQIQRSPSQHQRQLLNLRSVDNTGCQRLIYRDCSNNMESHQRRHPAGDKSTVHPGSAITQLDKYTFDHRRGVPGPSSDPYETGRQPPKGQEMPEPPPHVAAFCAALPAIARRIRKSSGYRARTFVAGENTSVKGVRSAADDLEKAFYEDHRGQVFEIEYFKRVCQHMRVDWDDHIENALRCARMRLRQDKRLETIQYPER